MDIFDTSAVRSVSNAKLAEAAKQRTLVASPITFYELLCHLDEVKDGEDDPQKAFLRNRGQLLKLRHFQIADDPYASHMTAIGAANLVNPSRFEEAKLLSPLLKALDASETLEEFYSREFEDEEGRSRLVRDCALRARQELDQFEQDFKTVMADIKNDLLSQMEAKTERRFTDAELLENIAIKCIQNIQGYKEDGADATDNDRFTKLASNALYPHYGYVVARAMEYALDPQRAYDVNDVEDGTICYHLNLAGADNLITDDGGTLRCLSRSLRAISLPDGSREAVRCRVIKTADYLHEVTVQAGPLT